MYERFYGLYRPAFAVTPDPSLLYMSRAHREALATIIYGIESRKGFIVCTGEVGTGKTTVIRAFFDQARAESFKIIYLFTPQIGPLDMARYICAELGLAEPESVFAAVPVLQLKLLETFESGRTVVLMIDEAQLLPAETLEFLRLLSNFETDTEKLIQIVLVGQPEVDEMLARRDMRQVAQRIALRARLGPLSLAESVDYMAYRLVACGAREMSQVMTSTAGWTIAEASGGIPRRINILADNVLIAGFGADQRPVGSQLAAATVAEFQANSGGARVSRPRRFGLRRRAERLPAPGPHPFEPWQEAGQPPGAALAPPEPASAADALWEIASRTPAPESNVVRPQFLGGRVGERASAGGSSAWQLEVRPQQRFRLRARGEAISGYGARRAGTSS
ncbi:MAG TPA: AAA family ATPase [Stellaceae bacterium]|jgi:general secretion pathway protein A|nr:AAA family ATPase [Stellaceae bacterium]